VQTALGIQFGPHSAAEGRGVLSDGHKQPNFARPEGGGLILGASPYYRVT